MEQWRSTTKENTTYFTVIPILLFITLKAKISTSGFSRTKTSSTYRRWAGNLEATKTRTCWGKFQLEVGSKIITEFVALSPKSYCYKYWLQEVKKAKGVSLSISEKTMAFADYKRVLDSNQPQTRTIYGIRSFKQQFLYHLRRQNCSNEFLW